MREGRLERRLADAMRAASDALRAAANALEEYSDERGRFNDEDLDRQGRVHREGDSYRRDPEPGRDPDDEPGRARDGTDDGDETGGAAAHPPLPPYPPYPPFPPYPPMPPIIIACGCACGRGTGYFAGFGHGVNAGWPLPPPGAVPAQTFAAQGGAGPSTFASRAPSFQPPSPAAVPAGGMSFAVQAFAASPRPDSDGESGVAP